MIDFFVNLVKEFITWQTLFVAAVVMFLTETIKKSTKKFIKLHIDRELAEKKFQLTIAPNGSQFGKERIAEIEKRAKLKMEGLVDFIFSWLPILLGVFFAVFVSELFPGTSVGLRISYGILAGAGSSILYKVIKQVVKFYLTKYKVQK